jgi:hypothetical protein
MEARVSSPWLSFYAARLRPCTSYYYKIVHTHDRVWITLIKLLYAPLGYHHPHPDVHQSERICTRLLPSVLWVAENNLCRKPGLQE